MKAVQRDELLSLGAYERVREPFLRRMIQEKRVRRVALGPNMTALFENHDTVLFQIQEMLRAERISAEAAIRHELDTYNALIPKDRELSVTVFIEYDDRAERERMLAALAGIEACFFVEVNGERSAGVGERRGDRTDRATAVHYLKFPLSEAAAAAVASGATRAKIGVEHARYRAEAALSDALVASLQADST